MPIVSAAIRQRPTPATVLTKATLNAALHLDIRHRELASIIGSSEASISRLKIGRLLEPSSKEGELALLFLRLYRSLDALVGGDHMQARAWLTAENAHVRGRPIERITSVEGLIDVVHYLDAMRRRL